MAPGIGPVVADAVFGSGHVGGADGWAGGPADGAATDRLGAAIPGYVPSVAKSWPVCPVWTNDAPGRTMRWIGSLRET
ncbi:MAG TPA: hypothetical protein VGM75_33255, partial [Pseudonocardiaceae bacterium]